MVQALRNRGVQAALLAALLFGAGSPIAKLLLGGVSPWMLAGLLYCGSGIGLGLIRLVRRSPAVRLQRRDLPPLLGAIVFGGIIGPVLLMFRARRHANLRGIAVAQRRRRFHGAAGVVGFQGTL